MEQIQCFCISLDTEVDNSTTIKCTEVWRCSYRSVEERNGLLDSKILHSSLSSFQSRCLWGRTSTMLQSIQLDTDACSYSICMAHKHCCYHSGVPRREDFFVSSAVTLNASRPRSGPAYPVARLPCDFLMFFCVGDNSKY